MAKERVTSKSSTSTPPGAKELKKSVERLQALMEEIPTGVINVDAKGKITYVNKTILQATGYSREELVGKNAFRLGLIPPETLKLLGKRLKDKLMGKPPSPLEIQFKRKDGEWMWIEISGRALWEHGVPVGVQIVGRDITDRRQAEEKLKSSEERLKILFEFAPDAYYLNDLKGNFIDGNRAAEEITGYKRDELIGKSFLKLKLLPPRQIPKAAALLAKNALGQATGPDEFTLNRKDGTQVPVETRTFPIKIEGKTSVLGIARDITERKQAEEALRKSEERYHHLFDDLTDAAFLADVETGLIVETNQQGAVMLGRSHDEIIGMHQSELHPPDQANEYRQKFATHIQKGHPADYDGEVIQKDGTIVPVTISASTLTIHGHRFILGLFRDITERKRMEKELREAQEQLVRSEKLAAIGQLAGGVGHELRNPLAAIKNAVYYVKGKVAESELAQEKPRLMEFLNIMDEEINSSNKIISDLLGFSRVGKPSVSPTGIEKIIEDTLPRITIPENIELTKKLDGELPEVEIDPDQIQQVLVNIITNAVQAMPEGGKLTIVAREKDKFVEVEVADTGCGIPQESVNKIFDPLFTTRAKGIGLGLAVCKSIIDRHEGNITVKSKVGKGTTISIKLPLESE